MRVFLIQAVSTIDNGEAVYPLGLARLAAALRYEHDVRGIDLNLLHFPWLRLVESINDFKPDVVGVSFRNLDPLAGNQQSFVPQLKALTGLLKNLAPDALLLIGGAGFTLFAERLMRDFQEYDIGFKGEAEESIVALLRNPGRPELVPGLLYRSSRGLEASPTRCKSRLDLNLELPDWDLFPPRDYLERNRFVAFMGVETKRGCPHQCRYCLYPVIQGNRVRLRPPADVVDELEMLHAQYGLDLFHFTDPVVNQPTEHLRRICLEIIDRGLPVMWTGFFREDGLTGRDLDLYCRAGLTSIYFSGDGASAKALALLNKALTPDKIRKAALLAAITGLPTVYHFLINLPSESHDTAAVTRDMIGYIQCVHEDHGNPAIMVFNNLRLYPGAPLTEEILEQGLIDPRTDLLYPVYFNPPPFDGLRHELTAQCLRPEAVLGMKPGKTAFSFGADTSDPFHRGQARQSPTS